ncbi:hypothetical protein PAAG_12572 [Paracoccidioides lutzii Pb01]|uniref:Uncharacterized protein n=1 Tax=Paracoccidioides lutzii (strain ATCC MYA-826 / Pb01) TaxID=502779 RepID=A0A0A2VIL8_PARBA|nr:hypothetical protein PAAG_12572 [Paracoccidioides lutzii Pb01]KGQ00759.1 hypothetical protein PAAG_12572 [Paracoccidioides lutzii Pb01]
MRPAHPHYPAIAGWIQDNRDALAGLAGLVGPRPTGSRGYGGPWGSDVAVDMYWVDRYRDYGI